MKKIGILGANGRMGRMIAQEIQSGHYNAALGAAVNRHDDKDAAFKNCDVMIYFTLPEACTTHIALAVQYKKPLVIGTTGLSSADEAAIRMAAQHTAVLPSANMSIGVNLLLALIEQAATKLREEFDIEIFEAHHRNKVDAPSGTALALGHAAAKGRGVKLHDVMTPARNGHTGPRPAGTIGMSVLRGGDIVGEHTVTFAGLGERLELTHKATDRRIFATGALKAALWLAPQKAGFYTMADVLK